MLKHTQHRAKRSAQSALCVCLVALAGHGCLVRPIPIPPPMTTSYASTACAPSDQCGDGVIFTVEGLANPGAVIVATNSTRALADGNGYSVSTIVLNTPVAGDGGVRDGGAPRAGTWRLRFDPVQTPPMGSPATVCHVGDRIVIRQIAPDPPDQWQQSPAVEVIVPAP